jgi:protein-S-isoprenylcysteine O-methyltransferase Ste14
MEPLRRTAALVYGVVCYALFFVTFLYLVAFVGNFAVPKTIDSGVPGDLGLAIVVDGALLVLFGLQHSVMARPGFKRAWTRIVPAAIERSTYVLASTVVLAAIMYFWQPIPTPIYDLGGGPLRGAALVLYLTGYGIVLYTSFLIDHFDLFGLRQVFLRAMGRVYTEKRFKTPSLYKVIRHPLYLGWFISFWAAPVFSVGHLLYASFFTAYILIAIPFEERDLTAQLGEPYERWRANTPAFVPRVGRGAEGGPIAREVR